MSWRRIFQKRRRDTDLQQELASYLELETADNIARGMSPSEARLAARRKLGNITGIREAEHHLNTIRFFETVWADLRFAARGLARNPGFTFFAVLTIALGLGANAAIFSLVDGVLVKATGYPEPDRIVQLWERGPSWPRNVLSPANYIDWTQQSKSFSAMAAENRVSMTYSGGGEPRSLSVGTVSAPYFEVFGVKAAAGRTFAPDEDQAGKGKVAVLTHRLWQGLFGADPQMLGRSVQLNGESYTVIGILPGSSEFDRRRADLWIPLVFDAKPARDYHSYTAVARLKPGVSLAQAQSEMSAIAANIALLYPAIKKDWGATVDRYIDRLVGNQLRLSLTILMWAVVAVLLIGCANLANLLMARTTLRSREIALRTALGARRGRIVRLLLTESLLLSACGALAGVMLGYGLLHWIKSLLPPFYFPAEADIAMDGRVLLFLAVVTILTGIAFGLAPALAASRRDTVEHLKEGGRSNSSGRSKVYARQIFVAAQVAAALILLVGSGLLLRSFERVLHIDTGFQSEGLVSGWLPLAMEQDPDPVKLTPYIHRILDEVRAVPGVTHTAVGTGVPLQGWGDGMPFRKPEAPNDTLGSGFKIVTHDYFAALGLHLVAGRFLDARDTAHSPAVIVVNESFAKRYYPGANPLGKTILVAKILPSRLGLGPELSWEIVGVVADEKGNGLESTTDEGVYASFEQNPVVRVGLVAKGGGRASSLIPAVREAVWRVNKNQVIDRLRTVEEIKTESMASRRMTTSLLAGFAFLAMLLACAGIYGVLSFVTASRSQELGIRAAMGATRTDLIRMVLSGGAKPVLAGIAIGLIGSIALSRFIQSMLFATDPIDAQVLISVSLLFLTVALGACFLPAWRASSVDPMSALRQD
ncbi:ABC transporter permease [Bryobacter aggregatus]|uniref:ABC transporter permease n=1 Tax=Bryobacter aggregatus TaxID=360054 RepID=UPI000691A29F|nr:ABC transporter permease [Bryobacter aggregatus]